MVSKTQTASTQTIKKMAVELSNPAIKANGIRNE
jgi:hypothetical protein